MTAPISLETQQQIFDMLRDPQLKYAEIAERTGITSGSVARLASLPNGRPKDTYSEIELRGFWRCCRDTAEEVLIIADLGCMTQPEAARLIAKWRTEKPR